MAYDSRLYGNGIYKRKNTKQRTNKDKEIDSFSYFTSKAGIAINKSDIYRI